MNVVDEVIRQWEQARAGSITELEQIPEEHWSWRPAEGARSLRALARHLLNSGLAFTEQLLREDGSFAKMFDPEFHKEIEAKLPKAETKQEILDALRDNGAENSRRLREIGEALAEQSMPSGKGAQSRLTGLVFAVSHEGYHRGQIALYVRLLGQTPALTKQMQGRSAG